VDPASNPLRVGIVGLGYWGPNVLRNFRQLPGCRVVAMADADPARLAEASGLNPDVREFTSGEQLVEDPQVDAVVLALPAHHLPELAARALAAGKHVLVEKPMAPSLEAGEAMLRAAEGSDRVTMVDFTFVYSPAVRYLRAVLEGGELGSAQYYQSTRINLGRFQPDVDVVWDLVVHDVSILTYLLDRDPTSVLATGSGRTGTIDTAHVTLTYDEDFHAFVHVSWLAPIKVRTSLLACRNGMAVYNDVDPDEKIRLYQIEETFDPERESAIVPTFRLGDVRIPRLPQEEPLRAMAERFRDATAGGSPPETDWRFGVRVLRVLEAARRSLRTGETVPISSPVAS
jgi:predicted dehydrogenase